MKFLDPEGKVAVLIGTEEERKKTLATIRNTIPAALRMFVRTTTNKQGQTVIDTKFLRMAGNADSGNFRALSTIAFSNKTFALSVSMKSVVTSNETLALGANVTRKGVFLDQGGLSPNKSMSFIFVGGDLNQRAKAITLAHEIRHAALFAQRKPFEHEMGLFEESPGVFVAYNPNGPVNRATLAAEIEARDNFDPFYPQD
jgi:hypothetical protein